MLLNDELAKAQRGIPQGSAASPLVAEVLLAPMIYLIPEIGGIVAYADNILLLAKSKEDVVSMSNALWSALKAHPAGPFQPKVKHFQATEPIDFLGHRFTRANGVVRIDPTPQNTAKFTKRMEAKLQRLKSAKLTPIARARRIRRLRREILSWTNAFKLCNNIETVRIHWLGKLTQLEGIGTSIKALSEPIPEPQDAS